MTQEEKIDALTESVAALKPQDTDGCPAAFFYACPTDMHCV